MREHYVELIRQIRSFTLNTKYSVSGSTIERFFYALIINRQCMKYSKVPILRPPLGLSKSGLKDHI